MSRTWINLPRTLDEFRVWHARQPGKERYEFIDGRVIAWEPADIGHGIIKSNFGAVLHDGLGGAPWFVLVEGSSVEVAGASLLPDVMATREASDMAACHVEAPEVVVEVLPTDVDLKLLRRKEELYLAVPSLRHYLVVHRARRRIVHHRRRDELGGLFTVDFAPPDPLVLDPPGASLALDKIYRGLKFADDA